MAAINYSNGACAKRFRDDIHCGLSAHTMGHSTNEFNSLTSLLLRLPRLVGTQADPSPKAQPVQ